ncbi:MAG: 4Fe-4S binding protein [Chlorobiaceae bacterium]
MAHRITEECTYCGACEPECPVSAITAGEMIYIIDEASCIDCIGWHNEASCVEVCPVDSIIIV